MTRKLVLPTLIALVAALAACSQREAPKPAEADASPSLNGTLDGIVTSFLKVSPEYATTLAVSEQIAGGKYADRLSDSSREGLDRQTKITQDARAALGRIDRAKLSPADQVTYDVVVTNLDDGIAGTKFGFVTTASCHRGPTSSRRSTAPTSKSRTSSTASTR